MSFLRLSSQLRFAAMARDAQSAASKRSSPAFMHATPANSAALTHLSRWEVILHSPDALRRGDAPAALTVR